MSGLVNFVKKTFKKVVEVAEDVIKSDVFKVVVATAAVVFTGGAALAAVGGGSALAGGISAVTGVAGTLVSSLGSAIAPVVNYLQAGFQYGLNALGSVGTSISNTIKTVAGKFGIGAGAAAGGATGTAAATGMHPLVAASLLSTGGQMVAGYAQGRAQEKMNEQDFNRDMSRDRYGMDSFGRKTADLTNSAPAFQQIINQENQRPGAINLNSAPSLQTASTTQQSNIATPGVAAPSVSAPVVQTPGESLQRTGPSSSIRDRLLLSLDGLKLAPVAGV